MIPFSSHQIVKYISSETSVIPEIFVILVVQEKHWNLQISLPNIHICNWNKPTWPQNFNVGGSTRVAI